MVTMSSLYEVKADDNAWQASIANYNGELHAVIHEIESYGPGDVDVVFHDALPISDRLSPGVSYVITEEMKAAIGEYGWEVVKPNETVDLGDAILVRPIPGHGCRYTVTYRVDNGPEQQDVYVTVPGENRADDFDREIAAAELGDCYESDRVKILNVDRLF